MSKKLVKVEKLSKKLFGEFALSSKVEEFLLVRKQERVLGEVESTWETLKLARTAQKMIKPATVIVRRTYVLY